MVEATIKIDANSPSMVTISGRFNDEKPRRNLSFLLDFAGRSGLGNRISGVRLTDSSGKTIASRQMIPGEYLAESDFTGWSYALNLAPGDSPSASAHTSWLKDSGILMLDDILPITGKRPAPALVTFDGWEARDLITTEQKISDGRYEVRDIEKAVFFVSGDRRYHRLTSDGLPIRMGITDEWLFTDNEAAVMVQDIYADYRSVFGGSPVGTPLIAISKFRSNIETANWEGDTRGLTVTILSSDMPFKAQSLQRLHEQLRHEIFHLWVPNGVALSGNYDWFYEGFALYQSLKTGVKVNRIRFDDMLDTLSRVYEIDRLQTQKRSLVEASKNRWNGANTQVYVRGMLVAFLTDLSMLEASKGKRGAGDLLRELYEKYRGTVPIKDGNEAVIEIMKKRPELASVVARNVVGADAIDWTDLINAAGITAETKDQLTRLTVTDKPSGRQKDTLDKLGYNSWRKIR